MKNTNGAKLKPEPHIDENIIQWSSNFLNLKGK